MLFLASRRFKNFGFFLAEKLVFVCVTSMTLFCDFLGAGFTTSKGTVDFNYRYGSYAPRRLVLVPGTDSARMVVGELRNVWY